jgi:DNA-binding response OmpR family regulator
MKKHILVIDDDESMRISMTRILERSGYEVSTALDGREGIRIFENVHIDLILTDIYMPDMDGLGVLLKLKTVDSNVKIIAMSGGSKRLGQEFLNFTKDFGAHFAIKKPFSNDEILLAIKSLLPD